MQYHLALDPNLNLTCTEFKAAWNSSIYAKQAEASVLSLPSTIFLSPEMTGILLSAVLTIPATVIATFVTDYLKKQFPGKSLPIVTVTTICTPDGKPIWIIKKTKET